MIPENAWYATDRKDNALATATKAADTNAKQVITHIHAAYGNLINGTVVIKEGVTTKATLDVQGTLTLSGLEMEFASGAAVSAELSASGTVGTYGSILLHGYTK